ncbi:hypothetical protein Trydic_g18800 [Trypoxylus dichotomus]
MSLNDTAIPTTRAPRQQLKQHRLGPGGLHHPRAHGIWNTNEHETPNYKVKILPSPQKPASGRHHCQHRVWYSRPYGERRGGATSQTRRDRPSRV